MGGSVSHGWEDKVGARYPPTRMARLLIFFVCVFVLTGFLAQLPLVGALFRIPFLGFWFTALLVSAVAAKLGAEAVDAGARRRLQRSLGAVDTPHHKGKLGALLLSQGKAGRALPLLEAAVEGDPSSLELRYRLGEARLRAGADPAAARDALDSVLREDEEYAYGGAMLRSAEAARGAGDVAGALERVARFERNHGASPESAFLRARLLREGGDPAGARVALGEVVPLAVSSGRGGASRTWTWRLRTMLARCFG